MSQLAARMKQEMANPSQKRARSSTDVQATDAMVVAEELVMDGMMLKNALAFLTPKDLVHCSQVCRLWNKEIISCDISWKQASSNISSKAAFEAMEKAMSPKKRKKLDYKSIAKGLFVHQKATPLPPPPPPPVARQVNTQAEDLFLLLEIKYDGKTVWAGCKSLKKSIDNFDRTTFVKTSFLDFKLESPPNDVLLVPPPKDPSMGIDNYGSNRILHAMTVDGILWRCDKGQSFSLFSDVHLNETLDDQLKDFRRVPSCGSFVAYARINTFADNPAGDLARAVCTEDSINYLSPDVLIHVQPVLPPPGSSDEPNWLKEFRDDEGTGDTIEDQMFVEPRLEACGKATYQLADILIDFRFSMGGDECPNDNVNTSDDFLIFLDGLKWE